MAAASTLGNVKCHTVFYRINTADDFSAQKAMVINKYKPRYVNAKTVRSVESSSSSPSFSYTLNQLVAALYWDLQQWVCVRIARAVRSQRATSRNVLTSSFTSYEMLINS